MIPTIRFQILKYSRGNYVRLFWGQHHGRAAPRAGGSTTRGLQHPRVVQDRRNGRLAILIDHFPGGIGQPNAVPWPSEECPERVVFANASQMRPYRGRGVLRLSEDGGHTWIASRTFNPAHYVYQCMTILPDGTLDLLWEREMQGLYFTRIPLEWIEAAKI